MCAEIDISREQLEQAMPRVWARVLQMALSDWQAAYRHLPCKEEAEAAIVWEVACRVVEFAQITPAAWRAVERVAPVLGQQWIARCFPGGGRSMVPPPLPSCPDVRWSWRELRRAMEGARLTVEDATALMRYFGKPSLGTHASLMRRLEWLLPPEDCAWHPWAKEALWRIARRPICAAIAKRKFHLVDRDLQTLVPRRVENPHRRTGPPMRLYEIAEVARIAQHKVVRRGLVSQSA